MKSRQFPVGCLFIGCREGKVAGAGMNRSVLSIGLRQSRPDHRDFSLRQIRPAQFYCLQVGIDVMVPSQVSTLPVCSTSSENQVAVTFFDSVKKAKPSLPMT